MDAPLRAPTTPATMVNGYQTEKETELKVDCHDHAFKHITISDAATTQTIFHVKGRTWGTSWSWRRTLFDENENPIFDFRHENLDIKNKWVVEVPGQNKLGSLVHKKQISSQHSAINATVRTVTGAEVLVEMRPVDSNAVNTVISIDESTIATIERIATNEQPLFAKSYMDRSNWKVRVAADVDLSLVMVMVLCRVEMGHVWKQ
ncbi:hypothetical protein F4805DRAFT_458557 [Annulohypoxylon moriforme]|nr:hypothetical protein F4805DRAFT_458557 [Annulohypoxylon moriforme]